MGGNRTQNREGSARQLARTRVRFGAIALLVALVSACAGCRKPVNTTPLDNSGMSYDTIQQLKHLNVSDAEVAQIAQAREAGFTDDDCVAMLKMYRGRHHPFDAGDAVAGLAQVGMTDSDILALAQMNQLGVGWGELQAMKLAGMSDAIVMEEARQRASGKHVLSGATLAQLKNDGVRESTLFRLVERGVPASEGRAILAYRHRGASEREILRHFAGS